MWLPLNGKNSDGSEEDIITIWEAQLLAARTLGLAAQSESLHAKPEVSKPPSQPSLSLAEPC